MVEGDLNDIIWFSLVFKTDPLLVHKLGHTVNYISIKIHKIVIIILCINIFSNTKYNNSNNLYIRI